ncbi:LacI family DNA-binding transcriptional regulator [Bacillus sp. DTU_2020_1000418_1_SI_GHA_SEK_038]|uniref:LacI family DNA-binding transcriptional regulator n=1 Tax=Bacillus sp. DTU_2020_1000418_1_SI_GHA_SEK_038 TaxID=3077585 RepID=UPI0028E3976A|nr:LacI family DNA-binding transcriptional regulator [Bacillus sp. DTU_2020_1000418_1_SI_GHA_SEK_038]WNS73671.1 LacI family DNA-binding transcriptional regulator [Bacillus sp. DTU_2020_1000418_1_SI_GHA_SEK_038]
MSATIKDVAKLAGVSTASVSRVINSKGYVSTETRKKIEEAIKLLNFEPNEVARSLTVKKSKTIALFIPDITNPFFATLAKGVEDYVNFRGFTLILCNYEQTGKNKKVYVDLLKQKYVDGIIFAAGVLNPEDAIKIRNSKIPLVVLDRVPDMDIECEILVDNYKGAKQAVEHLLKMGCKKIAHIYGPLEISTARERLKGYEDVVQHYSWFTPSLLAQGHFSIEGGIEATRKILDKHPDVDGIFAGNDMNAIGALKLLYQKGIKVPEELAICGYDGISLTEITTPEITTVVQPTYKIGNLAAEHLIHYIEHSYFREKVIKLDTKLVVRESTLKSEVKT